MPAGHQHRTTVSVAKRFMFSPNDGKLTRTVMQPDERGSQRRQKGETVRVQTGVGIAIVVQGFFLYFLM